MVLRWGLTRCASRGRSCRCRRLRELRRRVVRRRRHGRLIRASSAARAAASASAFSFDAKASTSFRPRRESPSRQRRSCTSASRHARHLCRSLNHSRGCPTRATLPFGVAPFDEAGLVVRVSGALAAAVAGHVLQDLRVLGGEFVNRTRHVHRASRREARIGNRRHRHRQRGW